MMHPPRIGALTAMIAPRSIAILGASADSRKIAGRPLKHLIDKGYRGRILPVNPKYENIAGLRCWPDVESIPGTIDLAIIALPADAVIEAIAALGRKRVPAAVVFSSGFRETGTDGARLERRLLDEAKRAGVRICGPNCLGVINAFDRATATFSQYAGGEIPAGPVGFVSQSGAFGTAIASLARARGIGLGYFVTTGNECDVSFAETMRWMIDDPRIRVGAGYLEGIVGGRAFIDLARHALAIGKPLVVTKVGRMDAGRRAAESHTGSLAGEDRIFDAVARQYGIIRARNEEHMLDIIEVLASSLPPGGDGVGIVTQSGGAGVLVADRAEELGLRVPKLTEPTRRELLARVPRFGAVGNPVDVTGQFVSEPELLRDSLSILLADPGVDVGIVWLQLMHEHVEPLVHLFREVRATASKPFIVAWVAAPEAGLAQLRELGIAVLRGAEPAVDAVAALVAHARTRRAWLADAEARDEIQLPVLALPAGAGLVPTADALRLLARCGIPFAQTIFARSADDAAAAAESIGYPVAVKIESPNVPHKTEVGGVRLNLLSPEAVRGAFGEVLENVHALRPGASVEGVVVQAMATGDAEFVLGLLDDRTFGTVIMVGVGGVQVELLRDVAFRCCPVTRRVADEMVAELRCAALLDGYRGRPPLDRHALVESICALSQFGAAAAGRLAELDLNPVLLRPSGIVAVDAVLVLHEIAAVVPQVIEEMQ